MTARANSVAEEDGPINLHVRVARAISCICTATTCVAAQETLHIFAASRYHSPSSWQIFFYVKDQ